MISAMRGVYIGVALTLCDDWLTAIVGVLNMQ